MKKKEERKDVWYGIIRWVIPILIIGMGHKAEWVFGGFHPHNVGLIQSGTYIIWERCSMQLLKEIIHKTLRLHSKWDWSMEKA